MAGKSTFTAVGHLRSVSDSGFYPDFALRAAQTSAKFAHFKRHPIYREVLEHVDREHGAEYLRVIRAKWPDLLRRIEEFKLNDLVGDPIQSSYPEIGAVSPTTLRYVKVCCDLRELFGSLDDMHVAEIGVGYGGQFLLSDMIWQLGSWTLFDLDPVLLLASRFLECHLVRSVYRPSTLNRFATGAPFDLIVSNYAFSELPRPLQLRYVEKVLSKSQRGYLTMNTGKTPDREGHLTIDELRSFLPGVRILDEVPLTAPENFILTWGS